jgi:hypothetical protein
MAVMIESSPCVWAGLFAFDPPPLLATLVPAQRTMARAVARAAIAQITPHVIGIDVELPIDDLRQSVSMQRMSMCTMAQASLRLFGMLVVWG